MSNMRIAVPLLLLSSGASALSSLPSSPTSLLRQWRAERARATAAQLDPSRYHLQLLFVDDDNARGRVAEGMLEVAEGFGSCTRDCLRHSNKLRRTTVARPRM